MHILKNKFGLRHEIKEEKKKIYQQGINTRYKIKKIEENK